MATLQEKATAYFKSKPHIKAVYGTSDGFLFEKEPDAKSHARSLSAKGVETFKNVSQGVPASSPDQTEAPKGLLDQNAPEAIKALNEAIDVKMLQAYSEQEQNSSKPRKTVIDAIEARLEELAKNIKVNVE